MFELGSVAEVHNYLKSHASRIANNQCPIDTMAWRRVYSVEYLANLRIYHQSFYDPSINSLKAYRKQIGDTVMDVAIIQPCRVKHYAH